MPQQDAQVVAENEAHTNVEVEATALVVETIATPVVEDNAPETFTQADDVEPPVVAA